MDMFEPCKSQLPLNSSWGPNLFMDPHLIWGHLLAPIQLQHILYNPHNLRNFTWKPLWAVTPKWNLSGFVCRQVSVVLLPARLSCRVSTSKHIPESQTLCVGDGLGCPHRGWSDFWAGLCCVHNSVPFSPFKMPTFIFTKSLGATVRPVAVVWWCLGVASINQQVCDLNPTQMCWAQAAPMLGLLCCSTEGSESIKSLPYRCCCCGHWAVQIKSRMGSPRLAPVALWPPPARGSKGLNN